MQKRFPRLSLPLRVLGAALFGAGLLWLFGGVFGVIVLALGIVGRVCQPAEDEVRLS